MLDWDGWASPVRGLGPGERVAMWVRGCQRQCPGCIAPELWDSGTQVPVAEVASLLIPALEHHPRLTISGGEPMLQAQALAAVLNIVKAGLASSVVEVLVYTGFRLEELAGDSGMQALLAQTDVLVDGPYVEAEPNSLAWRGSDNQRVHLLSESARSRHGQLGDVPMDEPRQLQLQSVGTGVVRLIGIPKRGDLARMRMVMARRGVRVGKGM